MVVSSFEMQGTHISHSGPQLDGKQHHTGDEGLLGTAPSQERSTSLEILSLSEWNLFSSEQGSSTQAGHQATRINPKSLDSLHPPGRHLQVPLL